LMVRGLPENYSYGNFVQTVHDKGDSIACGEVTLLSQSLLIQI